MARLPCALQCLRLAACQGSLFPVAAAAAAVVVVVVEAVAVEVATELACELAWKLQLEHPESKSKSMAKFRRGGVGDDGGDGAGGSVEVVHYYRWAWRHWPRQSLPKQAGRVPRVLLRSLSRVSRLRMARALRHVAPTRPKQGEPKQSGPCPSTMTRLVGRARAWSSMAAEARRCPACSCDARGGDGAARC